MLSKATSPHLSTLFFHRAHGLVGYALTQDVGEYAIEVIMTILRRCAADGTFEKTTFPYTLSHYPTLLNSKKLKGIIAAK
jgi:hypothetical protein